jgi:mannose-6-phosphate isomerase-like protein (cupin superfamily)
MQYIVPAASVAPYSPPGHSDTLNRRLIGKDTVGARSLELVYGELQPGGRADRHTHADIDQAVYVCGGRALAEIGDERAEVGPGTALWIPAGVPHELTSLGPEPLALVVVYVPPLYR